MNGTSLPPALERLERPVLLTGIAALVACAIGVVMDSGQFLISYLYAYLFWLGIALGSMAFAMVHWLVGGRWGRIIQRFQEAAVGTLPLLAFLFIPVVVGAEQLYPWARPERVAAEAALHAKAGYLNLPFFIVRTVIYFAAWIALALLLRRWSLRADLTGDPVWRRRVQQLSAAGLIVYVATMTFASVDWVMSREPEYYSTIFGFIFVAGHATAALAFAIILLAALSGEQPLAEAIQPQTLNDLGTLLFTCVVLFSYLAFAQYLVNWSGNMQAEIRWYTPRISGGWWYVAGLLIVFHFFVPFFLLLSRYNKQHVGIIAGIAVLLLIMRLVDLFWTVAPSGTAVHSHDVRWISIVFAFITPLAIGGIWFAAFLRLLRGRPLLPQVTWAESEPSAHGT